MVFVLCWQDTSGQKAPGVRLIDPVTLDLRNSFLLPAGFNCKQLLFEGWEPILSHLPQCWYPFLLESVQTLCYLTHLCEFICAPVLLCPDKRVIYCLWLFIFPPPLLSRSLTLDSRS